MRPGVDDAGILMLVQDRSIVRLEFVRKTGTRADTNCPSLYTSDRGTYVIVGAVLHDTDGLAQIGAMLPGEIAVEIPRDVLAEITQDV